MCMAMTAFETRTPGQMCGILLYHCNFYLYWIKVSTDRINANIVLTKNLKCIKGKI